MKNIFNILILVSIGAMFMIFIFGRYHKWLVGELNKKFEVPDGKNVLAVDKGTELKIVNFPEAKFSDSDDPNTRYPLKIIIVTEPKEQGK